MKARHALACAVATLVNLFASPVWAATGSGAGDHGLFTLLLLIFGAAFTAVQIVPPLVGMCVGASVVISRISGQRTGEGNSREISGRSCADPARGECR